MASVQKFLVDGILSVASHNGVHRLTFYELSGTDSSWAQPCVEIAIPEKAMHSITEVVMQLSGGGLEKRPPEQEIEDDTLLHEVAA